MYKIVIIKNSYYKKYLYFNDSSFLRYMKILIKRFSHAIWLIKSGRQFVFKILYIQDVVCYTL